METINVKCYMSNCDHNTPENTCMYGITPDLISHAKSGKSMCEILRIGVLSFLEREENKDVQSEI